LDPVSFPGIVCGYRKHLDSGLAISTGPDSRLSEEIDIGPPVGELYIEHNLVAQKSLLLLPPLLRRLRLQGIELPNFQKFASVPAFFSMQP
jgi:hypothetical protein